MKYLELNKVSYSYDKLMSPVINNISCSFEKGKLYCIKGASGSGKSTLLSLIAGLDVPTSGNIIYDGVDITKINRDKYRAKDIGVIFQSYNLIQNATAFENIMLAVDISGKKIKASEVYSILRKVGIDEGKASRKILKLSGGEQQRIAIARGVASGCPILIADEPTGNLDSSNEAEIMKIFKNLAHDMNKCVIVVTHSEKATIYADNVLFLTTGILRIMD